MKLLETHGQFEEQWGYNATAATTLPRPDGLRLSDNRWIVYFTAKWCRPCQQLDSELLAKKAEEKGIPMWKCEITVNDYTAGYCGVRSIPTFVYFKPKTMVSTLQSSDTETVKSWIDSCA